MNKAILCNSKTVRSMAASPSSNIFYFQSPTDDTTALRGIHSHRSISDFSSDRIRYEPPLLWYAKFMAVA